MSPILPRKATVYRCLLAFTGALTLLILLAGSQLFAEVHSYTSNQKEKITLSANFPAATVGTSYNSVISVSGGKAPYKFDSSDVPSSLALGAKTGNVSGVPSGAGHFTFTVNVEDSTGVKASSQFTLIVNQMPISVAISPTSASVSSGATAQFTATVSNSSNTAVTWTASAGSVSTSGLFTSPVVTSTTSVVVTATSVADSTKSASATITVIPPVSVSVTPSTATVSSGGTQQFGATVSNTSNTSVTWSASAGSISSTGLFTAPVVPSSTTVVVTATSAANTSASASATLSVIPPVSISLAPTSVSVNSGASYQFTATVSNTSNTSVTWTVSAGSVSSSGLFTAPTVKSNATVTLTATSVADTTKSASATISVIAPVNKVSLEVLYPPTTTNSSDYTAVQTYLMNNPVVTGANLAVEWGMIDQGPGASEQYDWTSIDSQIAPWVAAGKKVNLIVWANSDSGSTTCSNGTNNTTGNCAIPAYVWSALGSANYTVCSTQYGNQQMPNYLDRDAFQIPYQQFMAATIQHYGSDANIGYIRFGLGHGGESFPVTGWNTAGTACANSYAAWGTTVSTWESYLSTMLNYESTLQSDTQLMVGITPMGVPDTQVPDFLAPLAVPMGIGFGSQGLQQSDITDYPNCTADWCNLFATYNKQVPLELQTYMQSCPQNNCTTGSLVNLVPFAVSHNASVLELYYQDWLLAFDPSYSGYSQYGASYAQVLTQAANTPVQ